MGRKLALAAVVLVASSVEGHAAAPLYDPIVLNIGIDCQWQQRCEQRQRSAMAAARSYIAHRHPPLSRIHLCNRNARRGAANLDWIGFNDCIRNPHLSRPRRGR